MFFVAKGVALMIRDTVWIVQQMQSCTFREIRPQKRKKIHTSRAIESLVGSRLCWLPYPGFRVNVVRFGNWNERSSECVSYNVQLLLRA